MAKLLSVMVLAMVLFVVGFVALVVAICLYAKYGVQPLSDAEIMQRVESHKSSFYRLERMLIEDRAMFVEAKIPFLRATKPAKIQEERFNEYQKLLADTGAVRAECQGGIVKITIWSNFPWAFLTDRGTEKYLINKVSGQYVIDIDKAREQRTASGTKFSSNDSNSALVQVHHGWKIECRDESINHFFGF